MLYSEEQKLLSDMATLMERIEGLPCRRGESCKWTIQQKAVAGGGITGAIAAIILSIYTLIGGGK